MVGDYPKWSLGLLDQKKKNKLNIYSDWLLEDGVKKGLISNKTSTKQFMVIVVLAGILVFYLSSKITIFIIPVAMYYFYKLYSKNNTEHMIREKQIIKYLKQISEKK